MTLTITRRDFAATLGSAAAWPIAARGQQRMPVIGWLTGVTINANPGWDAAFRQGLSETGYVEGQNVRFEYRAAGGQYGRLPALAAELVDRKVSVIAATGGAVTPGAAKTATSTIPVVFIVGSDPVRDGLVSSLNRPGGNVTGSTFYTNELAAKRLELLHDMLPGATRVAALLNPENANFQTDLDEVERATLARGWHLILLKASTEQQIDAAFADLVRQSADVLFVNADAFLTSRRGQIVPQAMRHAIPASFVNREFVAIGGLMSYGARQEASFRQAGIYAGRILNGEKASDLPVLRPTKFDLVININAAKALGLTIPPMLLALADEVIE